MHNAHDIQAQLSDERAARVILEIADFMLNFGALGHEEAADIPQFVRPRVLNEVSNVQNVQRAHNTHDVQIQPSDDRAARVYWESPTFWSSVPLVVRGPWAFRNWFVHVSHTRYRSWNGLVRILLHVLNEPNGIVLLQRGFASPTSPARLI